MRRTPRAEGPLSRLALCLAALGLSVAGGGPLSAQEPDFDQIRRLSVEPPRSQAVAVSDAVPAVATPPVGGTWQRQGAAPIVQGQATTTPRNEVTGAVELVVPHPTERDTLWIGSVNGGVFRTRNASDTSPSWTPLTDALGALSVGAMDLDPTVAGQPATLVFGVARTSSFLNLGSRRRGLFRSTDDGDSWQALDALMNGKNVLGVAARGQVVVACVDNADSRFIGDTGLYRSTDAGSAFARLEDPSADLSGNGVPRDVFCLDLAGDPGDPTRLYAALVDISGSAHGIYTSTDTGATWTRISPMAIDLRVSAAVAAELSVGGGAGVLYVALCDDERLADVSRTTDHGTTWTSLGLPLTREDALFGAHPGGQCSTHLSLVAHPTDPNVVFVGGDRQPSATETQPTPSFPNSIGADGFGSRLFRGEVGAQGTTWTSIVFCPPGVVDPVCGAGRPADGTAPHADSRAMAFDAADVLIETDDGGVYQHTDADGTSGTWRSLIGDLALQEQHNVAYDRVAGVVISGNQDNGSGNQLGPGVAEWILQAFGDGGDVAVGADDPVAGQSMRYFSSQSLGNAFRAAFDPNNRFVSGSFRPLRRMPLDGQRLSPQFVNPIAVHAADPTRMVFGAFNGVFESFDRGDTTRRIAVDRVNSFVGGRALCYGTAVDSEALVYGAGDGLFVRRSAPGSQVPRRSAAYQGSEVAGCALDPGDSGHVFVVDATRVFESIDGGGSWQDRSGDLALQQPGRLRSIAFVDGAAGALVVVGTDEGAFTAFAADGFATWRPLGSGLPPVPVFELSYDATDDVLVAGTMGRGAYLLGQVGDLTPPGL